MNQAIPASLVPDRTQFNARFQTLASELALQLLEVDPEIADAFAQELTEAVSKEWGGSNPYIGSDKAFNAYRVHVRIYREFNGRNHDALVRKYKISKQWLYQILRRKEIAEAARQLDLPGLK